MAPRFSDTGMWDSSDKVKQSADKIWGDQQDLRSCRQSLSHSAIFWRRFDKIPAVALFYNFMRTRQDTCSCTLLQFEDDSTRYLQLHSVTIWGGLDKIPAVALCYNLRRTRQDTCSRNLLQFDEDSTRYLQSKTVTIWWGLERLPAVALCYSLMRTRQDTCSRNYDWNLILLCLHSKRQWQIYQ